MRYALVFIIGIAVGLAIAVYLALNVLQIDMIYPAPAVFWIA